MRESIDAVEWYGASTVYIHWVSCLAIYMYCVRKQRYTAEATIGDPPLSLGVGSIIMIISSMLGKWLPIQSWQPCSIQCTWFWHPTWGSCLVFNGFCSWRCQSNTLDYRTMHCGNTSLSSSHCAWFSPSPQLHKSKLQCLALEDGL